MTMINLEIYNLHNFKKVSKERNPGIKKAIENALNELIPEKKIPSYISIMFIHIDGDPLYQRRIILN